MSSSSRNDHTLLIFLLALFLFNSPLSSLWSTLQLPWYSIFIAWLVVIVLAAFNHRRGDDNAD